MSAANDALIQRFYVAFGERNGVRKQAAASLEEFLAEGSADAAA